MDEEWRNKGDVLLEWKSLEERKVEIDGLNSSSSLLSMAASCLDRFMLANFAGFIDQSIDDEDKWKIDEDLSFDYNSPYKFARSKLYLWLAKIILIDKSARIENGFEKSFLTCRLLLLWQYLLEEPSFQLKKILDSLEDLVVDAIPKALVTEALIERMYAYLVYNEISKAQMCFNKALAAIDLKIEITGVLGKRTRFQENFIPQLVAKATGGIDVSEEESEDESDIPPNVLLHDDSLLETVCIAETDASTSDAKLPALSLTCMLASGALERKTQSTDSTMIEKCCTYLDEIISQRRNWAVQASALLQRCEFEKNSMRRVERACMQMESLSKLVNGIENKEVNEEIVRKRIKLLLASGLKPFWHVDALYAEILRSTGCIAEALVIYEKQEKWDGVIDCYRSLGQLEKAERLVRELIADHENEPTYWCLLGDILHDHSAYERAIEVSNDRSFRAHRSLGMLMLRRKQYEISYQHLKRSLELQPVNASAWFNFGCCAWKLEKWEEAAKAYRECVRYEPMHFQAWNNLAAVYEKLDDPEKAKKFLEEALKLNYEHFKMRENYMLLCVRTHDFPSAISSFHALLELNKQYKDDAIIEVLTQKLILLKNQDEESTKSLIAAMCGLLGRITSQQTCSVTIWRCYAELKRPGSQSSIDDYEAYVKLLERVFRTSRNKQDWNKDEKSCIVVLDAIIKMEEAKKALSRMKNIENTSTDAEIRITLKPVIASIEKTYGTDAVDATNNRLKEYMTKVKAFLTSSS